MVNRLRIARLDPKPYQPLAAGGPPDADLHRRLEALIRRHLAGPTASLLAAPAPTADGRVEWYSDLSGQPVPLTSLSPVARAPVEALLADRLGSLAALADRLDATGSDADLARTLRQALAYPGDETVYVVDGQPVLTFWGYQSLAAAAAAAQAAVSAPTPAAGAGAPGIVPGTEAPILEPAASERRRPRWLLPALGVLAVLLAIAGVFASGLLRWPPWGPDYAALLKTAGDEEQALRRRIAELTTDLQGRRAYCDLQRDLFGRYRRGAAANHPARRGREGARRRPRAVSAARRRCPGGARGWRARRPAERGAAQPCRHGRALPQAGAGRSAESRERAPQSGSREAPSGNREARPRRRSVRPRPPPPRRPRNPARIDAVETPGTAGTAVGTTGRSCRRRHGPPRRACRHAPASGRRRRRPDAAIVLDASGSMRLPASASLFREMQGVLSRSAPLGMLGGADLRPGCGRTHPGWRRRSAASTAWSAACRTMSMWAW